jgi:hypothetical protein
MLAQQNGFLPPVKDGQFIKNRQEQSLIKKKKGSVKPLIKNIFTLIYFSL